jgi:hypothetical protein
VRRWLVALAAVALAFALGLSLAAYNLDAWIDANRDAIARRAAEALGREVAFDRIGVGLHRGLVVRVAGLRVGDDPAFSKEPFLRAEAALARVALLPALRGRIEVERVLLRSPEIAVIRTAAGLSTASLGRAPRTGRAPAPAGASAPGALAVALVDLEDATLRHVDRRVRPAVETVASDVDFRASDLSPGAPIAFEMEAAVLGARRQNLRASGSVSAAAGADPVLDVAIVLDPLEIAAALATAPLAGRAPAALAGSGRARLELHAKGSTADLALEAKLDAGEVELRLGESLSKPRGTPLSLGLSARRRGDGLEIEAGELAWPEVRLLLRGALEGGARPRLRLRASSAAGSLGRLAYRDLALDLRAGRGRVEVPKLALAAHEGSFTASGAADLRAPAGPAFEGRLAAQGVALESVLAAWVPARAARARGRVDAELSLRGAGADLASIASSLVGGGEVHARDGVLAGVNPAADALRALASLPMLSGRKLSRLFESHPRVFATEDTGFERFEARLEVAEGVLHARDARLLARDFDATGGLRHAFGGDLDGSAVLAFSPELSAALVDAEKRLRFLRSPEGRVELPVRIAGTPGDVSVGPDLAYVASSASREALGAAVERALEGRRRDRAEAGAAEEPGAAEPPPASAEDVGREILRRGLESVLGAPRQE